MTETSETWQINSEIHVGDNIDESYISDAAPLQAWTVDSISPSETINGVTISFEAGPIGGKSQIFLKGKPTKAGTITWTIKLISSLYGSRHTHIITCILPIQGPYVESIEISGPDSIQVGKTATYTARVLPTDAYDTDIKPWGVTGWTDSSKAVLKLVSESGSTAKIQALEVGSGYIFVTSSGKKGSDSDYPENNFITELKISQLQNLPNTHIMQGSITTPTAAVGLPQSSPTASMPNPLADMRRSRSHPPNRSDKDLYFSDGPHHRLPLLLDISLALPSLCTMIPRKRSMPSGRRNLSARRKLMEFGKIYRKGMSK